MAVQPLIFAVAVATSIGLYASEVLAQDQALCYIVSDGAINLTGLPRHKAAYNPSIVPFGTGSLLLFRIDGTEGPMSTRIGAVALDEHFSQVGNVSLLDLRPPDVYGHTAEDPRVVWLGDELYVVYNLAYEAQPQAARGLSIAKLHVEHDEVGGVVVRATARARLSVPPGYRQNWVEKNWTPFVHNGQIFFIYRTNSPHIMRLPVKSLKDDDAHLVLEDVSHQAPAISWFKGEMRGGTPAIYDPNRRLYASFFHGKYAERTQGLDKYHANISFYAFAPRAPFAIQYVLPGAIEPYGLHNDDTATMSCAYPGGFIERQGHYYLVYGWQDRAIHVLDIDRDALWDSLHQTF